MPAADRPMNVLESKAMNRFSWSVLCALVALAFLGPARPAVAAPATKEARAKAKKLYIQGERKYSMGEFKEALQLFSAAYEALPLPGFLFNIGQCERQLGNHKKAIFLYRRYLQKQPDARNRALVEKLIAESEAALKKARPAPPRRQGRPHRPPPSCPIPSGPRQVRRRQKGPPTLTRNYLLFHPYRTLNRGVCGC